MNVTIRFFAQFRETFGAVHELTVPEGARLVEVLHGIAGPIPDGKEALFGPDGQLREYVIVMQGPERIERDRAANLGLRDGETIAVFPPVAGG
jgi:molybdopterin synthase sulfur carrier subunit